MKFKAQLRIPTEMYSYIEVSVEGEPEDIVSAYREFTDLVKPKEGVTSKDFNSFLDAQLNGQGGDTEIYTAMSERQKLVIQEVKKALNRIVKDDL